MPADITRRGTPVRPSVSRPITDAEALLELEKKRLEILDKARDENRGPDENDQRILDAIEQTRDQIIERQEREAEEKSGLTGEELDAREGRIPWRSSAPPTRERSSPGTDDDDDQGTNAIHGSQDDDDDPGGDDPGGEDPGGGDPDERTDGGDDNPRVFNLASAAAARRGIVAPPGMLGRVRARLPGSGVTDPPREKTGRGEDDNPRSPKRVPRRGQTSNRDPIPKRVKTARPQSDPRITDPHPEN